jgi:hypothetical protein
MGSDTGQSVMETRLYSHELQEGIMKAYDATCAIVWIVWPSAMSYTARAVPFRPKTPYQHLHFPLLFSTTWNSNAEPGNHHRACQRVCVCMFEMRCYATRSIAQTQRRQFYTNLAWEQRRIDIYQHPQSTELWSRTMQETPGSCPVSLRE